MKFTKFALLAFSSALVKSTAGISIVEKCKDSQSISELVQCVEENVELPIYDACKDATSLPDLLECVINNVNSPCIDSTKLVEIEVCVENLDSAPSSLQELVFGSGCLDEVSTCIQTNIQDSFEAMPSCMEEKLVSLGQCVAENIDTCTSSCGAVSAPAAFEIDPTNLATCSGIQDQIMDPLCEAVACCDVCADHFKQVAECVVNDLSEDTLCDFGCSNARRNLRGKFGSFFAKFRTHGQDVAAKNGIDLSNLNLPDVDKDALPSIDNLEWNIGDLSDLPKIDDLDLPDIENLPTIEDLPNIDLGDLNLPNIDIGDLNLPDIDIGDLNLPDIDIGDLNLPDIDIGDLNLPNIDTDTISPIVASMEQCVGTFISDVEAPAIDGELATFFDCIVAVIYNE